MKNFAKYQEEHINAIQSFTDTEMLDKVIKVIISCLKLRLPVLIFGNGGSAADALHFSAELVGKFLHDREALNVICLNSNQSTLTAWSNDYNFNDIFARQVAAHGQEKGVVIGISTSGKSKNIINGFVQAKKMGMINIGMTGNNLLLAEHVDYLLQIPSQNTPIIQEGHEVLYHFICQQVEQSFLDDERIDKNED